MHKEQDILKAIAKGELKAFSQFFYAHHQQIGQYVFSITKSHEISEEIVQDVFLKLWEQRENLPAIMNIKAYLFTITKNQTLNAIRKFANEQKKKRQWEQEVVLKEESESGAKEELTHQIEEVFEHAVSCLPPQQQKVFLLRQQGLKNAQIALKMDISPNSAKKYQQLALLSIEKFVRAKATITVIFCSFLSFF
ncbi:MAG: sigma-70 family RNA polymerase sigma factor [Acinetobacter sp.]|nr:MAG: sigma-70 family RNA polymerase sigma factor [Acinetobacter sp.]